MADIDSVIEEKIAEEVNKQFNPRNRAERRALKKQNNKKIKQRKYFIDSVRDVSTKLAYIDLIQKLRQINEENEKENENNDD